MQRDLDGYVAFYNRERTHQGYRTQGRTPYQAFSEGVEAMRRSEVNPEAAWAMIGYHRSRPVSAHPQLNKGYSHSPPQEVRHVQSSYEQIQARKVKARLRILQHAQSVSGNVSQTCRFFGVSRSLYYVWKKRFEWKGLDGLRGLKRRPHHIRYRIPPEIVSLIRIREECRYGAVRTSLYLQRH